MELRRLRYFVAVAEELNFTRAADRLGINQPPLSFQIQQLEEELGTPLFQRHARGVDLTDAGKLLLEEGRIILKQVEATETSVRQRARGETGQVRIGAGGGTYFHPLIPTILREYCRRYPKVVVEPQSSNTALLVAQLLARQIDAAFIRPPLVTDEGLTLEPLVREETVIALPVGHRLARHASLPLTALKGETLVLYPRALSPPGYDFTIAALSKAGVKPVVRQEAPDVLSVIPLVAAGFGISILPQAASRILADDVVYVRAEGDAPRWDIALAHRRNERSAAVKNLAAVARRVRDASL